MQKYGTKLSFFILPLRMYLMKMMELCWPVIIVMTLIPFVDSLVFRTAYYSESHAKQVFEVHEGS